MAKCFQVVGQGLPVRMSDDDAFQIVERDHDGQYCPKATWRASGMRAKLVAGKIVSVDTLARELQLSRKR